MTRRGYPEARARSSGWWRSFEVGLSVLGGVIVLPFLAMAFIAVAIEDGRPILFRQTRIGRHGKPFEVLKIRSMRVRESGPLITAKGDTRITIVGRFLRRYKLDELPQVWNVIRGEMAVVGPRPEVPAYVALRDPMWRQLLEWRPGLTDLATLVYRDEEAELARASDPERHYREVVSPAKLALNLDYLKRATPWVDLELMLLTIRYSLFRKGFDGEKIRRKFLPGIEASRR